MPAVPSVDPLSALLDSDSAFRRFIPTPGAEIMRMSTRCIVFNTDTPSKEKRMSIYTRFAVTRSSASLWRVTFDNPPIHLIDVMMMKELLNLLTEIERDKRVGVVLFDSADPDFFLAH
jgi:hypothetical protein